MFTIFSCPKEFSSLFGIIQRNAINSWLNLNPTPKIILFGVENEEIKKEYNHDSISFVSIEDLNEYKTPYINKIFEKAMSLSITDTLCYVNSDIILFNDFNNTINNISKIKNYFGVGQRYNLDLDRVIDFKNFDFLNKNFFDQATLDSYTGSDYFIFNKDTIKNIPNFLIGRTCWDNWLIYYASINNLNLIDCTNDIFCVHQKQDYSHIKTDTKNHYKGIERDYNLRQLGGLDKLYHIRDCKFILKNKEIKKNYSISILFHKILRKTMLLYMKEKIYRVLTNKSKL